MKLLVGCPVVNRSWILPLWYKHVLAAVANVDDCELELLFVAPVDSDVDVLLSFETPTHVHLTEETIPPDGRLWNADRYVTMVKERNALLQEVRSIAPDFFLSLDSDILLAPKAISSALELIGGDIWAVGLSTYMTPIGGGVPSMGIWIPGTERYYRYDANHESPCDIIMAAKLMSPLAYGIDYEFHRNGEDLGWSRAVQSAGGKFMFDGRVKNKHVMEKWMLSCVDERVGF